MQSLQVNRNKVITTFGFLLLIRLLAMFFIPLNDSTEARYGEIARIMLETGNWVTPMQEYGVPFWAKPPLSTWLSSISMAIFGVNEFAARLPALILSIGVLWMVWYIAKCRRGVNFALISCLILASSFFFYLDAGTVMTDPALLFSTTLTFFGFWLALHEKRKMWGYVFFVGLGMGMLAKGPIAWVLTGLPLGLWVIINNKWHDIWRKIPWFSGMLLNIFIFMPWYIIAEHQTPGFLNYFIIGENISRFLKPGWKGDMYGVAHLAPYGFIWLYALVGIFPWIILFLNIFCKNFKNILGFRQVKSDWISFLLIGMLTPLVFFTFASNIIYTYVFPILPFFALLCAELICQFAPEKFNSNYLVLMATSSGIIFIVITMLFIYKPAVVEKSQKRVVSSYNLHKNSTSKLVYWLPKADFSARFYTRGKVDAINNLEELQKIINNRNNFIVINGKYTAKLPMGILKEIHVVDEINISGSKYIIYKS